MRVAELRIIYPNEKTGAKLKAHVVIEDTITDPFSGTEVTVSRDMSIIEAKAFGVDLATLVKELPATAIADNMARMKEMEEKYQQIMRKLGDAVTLAKNEISAVE